MARVTAAALMVGALLCVFTVGTNVTGVASPDSVCQANTAVGSSGFAGVCIPACSSALGQCSNGAVQTLASLTFFGGPFVNATAPGGDYNISIAGVPCTAASVFVDSRTLSCTLTRAPPPAANAAVTITSGRGNDSLVNSIVVAVTVATWCTAETYADPSTQTCSPCPVGAACTSGVGNPQAIAGYYSVDASSWAGRSMSAPVAGSAILACPTPASCLGNQTCTDGSTGWLCATCAAGWVRKQAAVCTQCASQGVVGTLTFMIIIGTVVLATFMIRGAMRRRSKIVIVAKMMINYLQMTYSITSYVSWATAPSSSRNAASLANAGSLFSLDINALLCTLQPSYYTQFGLNMSLPLLAGVIPAVFLFSIAALTHCRLPMHFLTRRLMSFRRASRLTLTSMGVLWFFMHNSIGGSILRVWRCAPAAEGGYLLADPSVSCFTQQHDAVSRYAAPTLLFLYGFGIPAFYTGLVWSRRKYLASGRMLRYFGWIYDGFAVERGMWWFEAAIMLRKLTFVALPILIGDSQMQLIAGAGVLVAVLALQLKLQPFEEPFLNNLEAFALAGNFSLVFGMLVYVTATARGDTVTQDAMGGLMIGFNVCVLAAFACALVLAARTTAITAARVAVKLSQGKRLHDDTRGKVNVKRLADSDRRGGLSIGRTERALRHARVVTAFKLLQQQQRRVLTLATPRHLLRRGAAGVAAIPASPSKLSLVNGTATGGGPASRAPSQHPSRRGSVMSLRTDLNTGVSIRSFVSHGGSGSVGGNAGNQQPRAGSISMNSEWLFDGSDSETDEDEDEDARLVRRAHRATQRAAFRSHVLQQAHGMGVHVDLADRFDAASGHTGNESTPNADEIVDFSSSHARSKARKSSAVGIKRLLPTWLRAMGASPATSVGSNSSESLPSAPPASAPAAPPPLLRMQSNHDVQQQAPRSSMFVRQTSAPMLASNRSSVTRGVTGVADSTSSLNIEQAIAPSASTFDPGRANRISTRRMSLQVGLPVISEGPDSATAGSPSATVETPTGRTNRVIGMQRASSDHGSRLLGTATVVPPRGGMRAQFGPSKRRVSTADALRHGSHFHFEHGMSTLREASESSGSIDTTGIAPPEEPEPAASSTETMLARVFMPSMKRQFAAAQSVRRLSLAVSALPDASDFSAFAHAVEHVDVFDDDASEPLAGLTEAEEQDDASRRGGGSIPHEDSSRTMMTSASEFQSWSRRSSLEEESIQAARRALAASAGPAPPTITRPLASIPVSLLRNSTSSDNAAAATARAPARRAMYNSTQSWRGDDAEDVGVTAGGGSWWGNAMAWMQRKVHHGDSAGRAAAERRSRLLSSAAADLPRQSSTLSASSIPRQVMNPMTAAAARRGSVLEQVVTATTPSPSEERDRQEHVVINPAAHGRADAVHQAGVYGAVSRATTRRMLAPVELTDSIRHALRQN